MLTTTGKLVIIPIYAYASGIENAKSKKVRTQLIDTYSHLTKAGTCLHQIAVIDGAITKLGPMDDR